MLYGGADPDQFQFNAVAESPFAAMDEIRDFERRVGDMIDLRGIDANAGLVGNQAFTFIGFAPFSAARQLRLVDRGGGWIEVQGNTAGRGTPEFGLRVATVDHGMLEANDFFV